MDFTNATDFPAEALVGSTSDQEQTVMVVCKVTWRLDGPGGLQPVPVDHMWPVFMEPATYGDVTFLPEMEFRKRGIDVLVFGPAVAPRGRAIRTMDVQVQCGSVDKRVRVFGDRRWVKVRDRFVPSEPEPFETMPLTNDRAFGGSAIMAGEEVLHRFNPDGTGYSESEEDVEGKALPNLERPDDLITHWKQTPLPACMYKPQGPLLDAEGPESFDALSESSDPMALPKAVMRTAFNQAVPDLICPEGELGRTLYLAGFDADTDLIFPLPPETAVPGTWGPTVHVSVGEFSSRFPLSATTVVVLVPERVVIVSYLGLFRYLFQPEDLRSAELRWTGSATIPPPERDGAR